MAGLVGPLLSPYDSLATDLNNTLLPSSRDHWLGTDQFGRDVLTRVVYAIRVDLPIAVLAAGISFVLGTLVGGLAGYAGGAVDALVGRTIDVLVALPFVVLILAVVAMLGPGVPTILLGLILVGWITYARIMRAQVQVARSEQYVMAARALGLSRLHIFARHLLPNTISAAVVYATADVVFNVQLLAALSFLGIGVQPPIPEWGAMIGEGRTFLLDAWGLSTWPGLALVLMGLGFSLLGDGLRDRLDPMRSR